MGNCGECRFWGDAKDAGQTYRKCMAMVHGVRVYVDNGDDDVGIIIPRTRDVDGVYPYRITAAITGSAYVEDASDYYAALKCREDFGCVSWEAASG